MIAECEWRQSLRGAAIDENTAGVPPYDVDRVAALIVPWLRPVARRA